MSFGAELLQFSINPDEDELATFLVRMPRSILTEANTHRVLSRNAASSRAIPTRVMIERIITDPYIPDWTRKAAGMAGKPMPFDEVARLDRDWLQLRDTVIAGIMMVITGNWYNVNDVRSLSVDEIATIIDSAPNAPHKQDINRPLEAFLFMDWIVSGTEWANFFFQRVHTAAHPAFQNIAYKMARLYLTTKPQQLSWGMWHLPLVTSEDRNELYHKVNGHHESQEWDKMLAEISAARCGRVSFEKQNNKDVEKDLAWFQKHIYENASIGEPQHVSPAEHPAIAEKGQHGNFTGWKQLRKFIPGENHETFTLADLNKYEEKTGRELTR